MSKNYNSQASSGASLKPLLKYVRPHRSLLITAFILAAVSVAALLYAPILVGDAVDKIVSKDNVDFEGLALVLIKLAVTVAVSALSQWLMSLMTNRVTYFTVRDIRNDAFANIQTSSFVYRQK